MRNGRREARSRITRHMATKRDYFGRRPFAANAKRTRARCLRHLRRAATEGLRNPIGVRETASGKLKLLFHVVFYAPDCWLGLIGPPGSCRPAESRYTTSTTGAKL